MKTVRPHRAILIAVLLLSPALTTACGLTGRDGADTDQAALQKALSSVVAPTGLAAAGGPSLACGLNIDCADIASTITYAPVKGNLETCTAATALQGGVLTETVRWKAVDNNLVQDANWAQEALAGVAALRPSPADMTAACVKALSSKQGFMMLSDLKPSAVTVKSAKTLVTVAHSFEQDPQAVIALTYDGPNW
jgi:hypothetical protein